MKESDYQGHFQLFFARGNDIYVEGRIKLTPDTLIVYDSEEHVIAEFYREGVIGWRKA